MIEKGKEKIVCTVKNQIMPKYNPYMTGHGAWKSKKHPSRAKRKSDLRKEIF